MKERELLRRPDDLLVDFDRAVHMFNEFVSVVIHQRNSNLSYFLFPYKDQGPGPCSSWLFSFFNKSGHQTQSFEIGKQPELTEANNADETDECKRRFHIRS